MNELQQHKSENKPWKNSCKWQPTKQQRGCDAIKINCATHCNRTKVKDMPHTKNDAQDFRFALTHFTVDPNDEG